MIDEIGLISSTIYDKSELGHIGQLDYFQFISMHLPDENDTISYTFNGVDRPANDILVGALSIYSNLEYTLS